MGYCIGIRNNELGLMCWYPKHIIRKKRMSHASKIFYVELDLIFCLNNMERILVWDQEIIIFKSVIFRCS